MANNYDYLAIVNSINSQMGGLYDYEFPIVDSTNFKAMAAAFNSAPPVVQNAYVDMLRNLVMNVVIKKVYRSSNPFRKLYRDPSPLTGNGDQFIEEIAIDQFIPLAYEMTPSPDRFFASLPPKVKIQYMVNTLRKKYVVTFNDMLLQPAFTSLENFGSFVGSCMTRLYADLEEDDKEEIIAAIEGVIEGGNMFIVPMVRPVDSPSAIEFSKNLDILSRDLGFKRRREWNLQHLSTKTAEEDCILLVAGDVIAVQNNYNLAWAFNRQYLDLLNKGQMIPVDSDGFCDNRVFGIYTDTDFFRIHPIQGFPRLKAWENGDNLEEKRWLHDWKMVKFSYASNALCFVEPKNIGIESVTLHGADGGTSGTVAPGKFYEMGIPEIVATDGMLADAFLTYEISGATDDKTRIDKYSGTVFVGADETGSLTITGTSHLDDSVSGTFTLAVE